MNKKDRVEILFEHIIGQNKAISEGIELLKDMPPRLQRVEELLDRMSNRYPILEKVVKEHSAEITELRAQSHSH